MTLDAPDVGRPASEERGEDRDRALRRTVLAAALLGAAFLGAVAADVLGTVGPYLLGVSGLGLALGAFALARRRYGRIQ